MCFVKHPDFWLPQHALGYKGSYSQSASNNTILRQRGACWSFNKTTGNKQCNDNMMRRVCMAKAGFLGFNATKTCNQTGTVSCNVANQ
jgi:hypothetical protein